jgi:hypothetical protein
MLGWVPELAHTRRQSYTTLRVSESKQLARQKRVADETNQSCNAGKRRSFTGNRVHHNDNFVQRESYMRA